MAVKKKQKGRLSQAQQPAKKKSPLEGLELWLANNEAVLFWIAFALSAFTALFLFDSKLTLEGDDADYILRAKDLIQVGTFPGYQGPLYPIVLSVPAAIFGINIIILKFFSVLFSLGHIYFMYLAFRKRISYTALFIVLFFIALNSYIHFFSSQTFTEAFFFFIQAFSLWALFKLIDKTSGEDSSLANTWPQWALAGLVLLLLSISKNVGIVAVLALITYFIVNKRFIQALYALGAFLVFKLPYEFITRTFFNAGTTSQLDTMFLKNFYNPQAGKEDFSGMINRFIDNFQLYISKHTFTVLNLRPEYALEPIAFLSVLMLILFIAGIAVTYKNNKYLFFTGLYIAAVAGASFFALQAHWDQRRIIIILVPLMLLFILCGLLLLSQYWKPLAGISLALCGVILVLNLTNTLPKISGHYPVLKKNLSGDIYYGYTQDWVNFIQLSKWCSENLPDSNVVASRKPSISTIYGGGKRFYGIYKVPSDNPDTLYNNLKKNGVDYLLAASLRINPADPSAGIITTVHRTASIIAQKYPDRLEMVKTVGETEPAYLIKLK